MSDLDTVNADIAIIQDVAAKAKASYGTGSKVASFFGVGDGGTQEVGAIDNIVNVVIPSMLRIAAAGTDASGNFTSKEVAFKLNNDLEDSVKSLKEIGDYSHDLSLVQALKYTAIQSAQDVADAAGKVIDDVGGAAKWYADNAKTIWLTVGGLTVAYFFGPAILRALKGAKEVTS